MSDLDELASAARPKRADRVPLPSSSGGERLAYGFLYAVGGAPVIFFVVLLALFAFRWIDRQETQKELREMQRQIDQVEKSRR